MAIPKLKKVPIIIYSVSFISLFSFKSPNLKIDFAASKKPIPSQKDITTKLNINKRSKTPIYLPTHSLDRYLEKGN